MIEFLPDYTNIVKATKNIKPDRMPLYDHLVSVEIMEKILNKKFGEYVKGNKSEKKEFYRNYANFFMKMGYDTVSYEQVIGAAMPGSGALGNHMPGAIKSREDFIKYPWEKIPELFFERFSEGFSLLSEVMPLGMKVIGGGGNGVFELV